MQLNERCNIEEAVLLLSEWAFKGPQRMVGPFADQLEFGTRLHACSGQKKLLVYVRLLPKTII